MGSVVCFCCNRWHRSGEEKAASAGSVALVAPTPEHSPGQARPQSRNPGPSGKGKGRSPSSEDEAARARAKAKGPPPSLHLELAARPLGWVPAANPQAQ